MRISPSAKRWLLLLICVWNVQIACTSPPAKEIARVRSPDGLVEAVVWFNPSPFFLTSDDYEVYLVRTGGSADAGRRVLVAEHVNRIEPRWAKTGLLELHYDASIRLFENNWWTPSEPSYRVEIVLIRDWSRENEGEKEVERAKKTQ